MASPSNQDRIKAAKKALDESKSLYQKAQDQYAKAEALYNKAKVQANVIKTLSPTLPNISSPAAAAALGTAAIAALASNITPEQRAKTINDRKEAIRKIERKAEQELEKAKKAVILDKPALTLVICYSLVGPSKPFPTSATAENNCSFSASLNIKPLILSPSPKEAAR